MRAAPFDPLFFKRDPLFWPIARAASAFSDFASFPPVAEYGARVAHRAPVTFREQPKKPRRRRRAPVGARDLYDGRIVCEGWVPTRPGSWHDFLNMLVWAAFPEAKWQVHARQYSAHVARIEGTVRALPNARTREQDALALLDEGGVVLLCKRGMLGAVRGAFAERRDGDVRALFDRGDARAVVFGHAVYEELVHGRDGGWCAGCFFEVEEGALAAGEVAASAGDVAASAGDVAAPAREDLSAIVGVADRCLAGLLAREGSLGSPAELSRVDVPLLREARSGDIH
ncbi:MAG: DUF3025 domain-containing protein [Polyangiaceae bacterium]